MKPHGKVLWAEMLLRTPSGQMPLRERMLLQTRFG
jgi:hypothetical protein